MDMIIYNNNSIPNGDFPNLKTAKERHPQHKHFFLASGVDHYQIMVVKDDDSLSHMLGDYSVYFPDFKVKTGKWKIDRYMDGENMNDDPEDSESSDEPIRVIENCDGVHLSFAEEGFYFDSVNDALTFLNIFFFKMYNKQ